MQLLNSPTGFGTASKFLHWAVFLLFTYEYVVANMMLRLKQGDTLLGFTQGTLYNWHKSIGLVLLLLALLRITWRRTVALPDWAPTLTPAERTMSGWTESVLYWCMFLMPVSGYLFVMAGGYGVKLFGIVDLPNLIGINETLASAARLVHVLTSYGIVLAVGLHVGSALRHHLLEGDGFLKRMLPFSRAQTKAQE